MLDARGACNFIAHYHHNMTTPHYRSNLVELYVGHRLYACRFNRLGGCRFRAPPCARSKDHRRLPRSKVHALWDHQVGPLHTGCRDTVRQMLTEQGEACLSLLARVERKGNTRVQTPLHQVTWRLRKGSRRHTDTRLGLWAYLAFLQLLLKRMSAALPDLLKKSGMGSSQGDTAQQSAKDLAPPTAAVG